MPKPRSNALRVMRPSDALTQKMRNMGFGLRVASFRGDDTREMVTIRLIPHWTLESDTRISVIFDPEGLPRFVDFHGSSTVAAYFVMVKDPEGFMARLRRLSDRFIDHFAGGSRPDGFELLAWMCEHKGMIFHSNVGSNLARSYGPRTYFQPAPPPITHFAVRTVETGVTQRSLIGK